MENKIYNTKVSLSFNQALLAVSKNYTSHYTYNGDADSICETTLTYNRQFLLDLLTMPVNTTVTIGTSFRTRGAGSITVSFVDQNGKSRVMVVWRDGTRIAQDMVYVFVHAHSFGKFKYEWNTRISHTFRTKQEVIDEMAFAHGGNEYDMQA